MRRKPIDIPPEAARAFVRDMKAFFAAGYDKADEIAARQMTVLQRYQSPREKPLRIPDIKAMFLQMRDQEWLMRRRTLGRISADALSSSSPASWLSCSCRLPSERLTI